MGPGNMKVVNWSVEGITNIEYWTTPLLRPNPFDMAMFMDTDCHKPKFNIIPTLDPVGGMFSVVCRQLETHHV